MRLSSPATEQSPTLDVAKVIELEKSIEAAGTPLSVLMDQAGAALAELVAAQCDPESRILVVCGSGNNGGDGWVAARLLEEQGFAVTIATPKVAEQICAQPAHDAAVQTAKGFAGRIEVCEDAIPKDALEGNAAVVDCILGTGFDHDQVKEPYAHWIVQMNGACGAKIACDTPSGLSAQTGRSAKDCFHADVTITMLAVKTGLATPEAAPYTGKLFLAPLEER